MQGQESGVGVPEQGTKARNFPGSILKYATFTSCQTFTFWNQIGYRIFYRLLIYKLSKYPVILTKCLLYLMHGLSVVFVIGVSKYCNSATFHTFHC